MRKLVVGNWQLAIACMLLITSCYKQKPVVVDPDKPKRTLTEYFDKKYLLYKLPDTTYSTTRLMGSFDKSPSSQIVTFKPLGFDTGIKLQYTHIYSPKCVYHTSNDVWKYAEVCFPNTCLTKDMAYATTTVKNTSQHEKTYYLRLFYQNTSYWYATDSSINFDTKNYLDNYYGASQIVPVQVKPGDLVEVKIPYTIGMDPKGEFAYDPSKDPARPGNYEFMVIAKESKEDLLLQDSLNLLKTNPFAEVKWDEMYNQGKKYFNYVAYVSPQHFKFVFLDEYFDGVNDLERDHIYLAKDGDEKKLCDTCTGWYKAVINEAWNNKEFFEGYIHKAGFVKAEYGIRKENYHIDSTGITLTIPKSRRGDYKKTWGEFLFGPSYKYGHLTVRAKFPQMMTKHATSNGIVHNLWLYQRDFDEVDTTNPYNELRGARNKQPYEIDFEIWSSTPYDTLTLWDDESFINYSIVDYMRDPNVQLKPGEQKNTGFYDVERFNKRQASVIGKEFNRDFFNYFHTYELYWYPDRVRYLVDGVEKAVIPKEMAKIPDKHLFLWIGSPLYQDGTYYLQSFIPFLKYDKKVVVDYIKIE
ncbi:MAG TPA: family 16 glycosylhydrolase [Chitinophagales bacterium]|nr:family 16 glycosylhydrolase [Chitinophagales bacterium]